MGPLIVDPTHVPSSPNKRLETDLWTRSLRSLASSRSIYRHSLRSNVLCWSVFGYWPNCLLHGIPYFL